MGKGLIGDCYDIFNVHRAFMFSNFQFIDIEASKFLEELRKNKFLGKDFMAQYLSSAQFEPHFDFQPDYLVDDNIFEVFDYFFKISHYIYEMKRSLMVKPTLYQGSNIEILGTSGMIGIDGKAKISKNDAGYQVQGKLGYSTVRGNFELKRGKWYYEVRIITEGTNCQIGFAQNEFIPNAYHNPSRGVGDDAHSWGYDGSRGLIWNNNEQNNYADSYLWTYSDIIGCYIDLDKGIIGYCKNGIDLGVAFKEITFISSIFPCASIPSSSLGASVSSETLLFVFDEENMIHPPPFGYEAINVGRYFEERTNDKKGANIINSKLFEMKSLIIPRSTVSVWNEDIIFNPKIRSVDEYLWDNNINVYQRVAIETDIKTELERLDLGAFQDIEKLLIVIDRRQLHGEHDILYVLHKWGDNDLPKLTQNYFVGFDINILGSGTTKAYFRYNINQRIRFYPEMLTTIIPRLFRKPSEMNDYDYLKKLYQSNYKHGWCLDLNHDGFNKYYKIITGFDHISVNYRRDIPKAKDKDEPGAVLVFMDYLAMELENSIELEKEEIEEFWIYLMDYDYDTDTILEDVECMDEDKNKECFLSMKFPDSFSCIHEVIKKYTSGQMGEEEQKEKEINTDKGKKNLEKDQKLPEKKNVHDNYRNCDEEDFDNCPHFKCIITSLDQYQKANFDMNKMGEDFDAVYLIKSYDHIIASHALFRDPGRVKEVKEYVLKTVNECEHKTEECPVLREHKLRRRERNKNGNKEKGEQEQEKDNNNSVNGLKEIIKSNLNSLHTYLLHGGEKYRNDNSHIATGEGMQEKSKELNAINMGISVLQWLDYGESPTFASIEDEIIFNENGTVTPAIFLSYKQECHMKLSNQKNYTMDEVLSLKLYTDTTDYQSALRKAHWDNDDKETKKSFYFWAMQLYKTALYHSKPIPKRPTKPSPFSLYHGMFWCIHSLFLLIVYAICCVYK